MPSPARNSAHPVPPNRECIQFDRFDLDLRSGELRKSGHRIRLQAQPFQLLALLLKHPGEVVTRDEIRRTLWETDTFVDFDHSLAAAVNKIRGALGDSAESPRFVETLPKRGYRFIGEVRRQPAPLAVAKPSVDPEGAAISQATWHSGWPAGRLRTATWILLGVAGTLVLVLGWLPLRSRPESAVLTAVPFTSYPGTETAPALSPDGSRIAFSWDGGDESKSSTNGFDLYVKAIGSETLLRLTNHPSEWISSAWSPDGTQIAFHRLAGADTGVYVVPALGGPERKLRSTHVPYGVATEISWSPDGKWITYGDPLPGEAKDRVFLLSVDTLESRAFPHDPKCLHEANLIFSHSGKELAYLCVRSTRDFELYSRAVPNGSPRLAAAFPNFFNGYTWSGDDRKLIFSEQLDTGGELDEVTLRDGSLRKLGFGANASWPAVSSDGNKLAFSASTDQVNIWRKDLTRPEGTAVKLVASTREQNAAQYSPDGKHLVFDSARSGSWSVWMSDADGRNLVQISHGGAAGNPRWSPDSRKIAFEMRESDRLGIYVADVSERVPRKLVSNISEMSHPNWSRDGKWIYFRSYETIGHKIYRCPVTGGQATLLVTEPDGIAPQESFDGKTLYFASRNVNASVRMVSLNGALSESAFAGMPTILVETLWVVAPGGIYFVPADAPKTLCYFDFATKQIREVFKLEKEFDDGLSVSLDGQYILFSQVDEKNSDIMLVDHFR